MKNIVIKVHDNSKTIATHRLDINDKKPLIIQAKPHLNYEFIDAEIKVSPNHIVSKRGGDDLGILLNNEVKDAGILIIKDFYKYSDNVLIGLAEDNQYYYYIPDSGEIGDYVTQLADNKSSGLALGGDGFDKPWWVDNTNTKSGNSLKALLKSISSDEHSEINTSVKSTEQLPNIETKSAQTTDPSDLIKIISPEVKSSSSTDPSDLINVVSAKEETSGFLDNFDVSPWLLGVGVGVGTIALLGSGSGGNGNHSIKDKPNFSTKGNDKDNTLPGTDNNDIINGLAGNDTLEGKDGNDTLIGGDGFDTLIGGKGVDKLTGGNDSDTFVYKLSDLTDTKVVDKITDFTEKVDKIQLPKELFKADKVTDNLADYIKYDKSTGELSYDSDGKGGDNAVVFATLTNHVDLTVDSENFQII